ARYMPNAAQHHHAQHHDGFGQAEALGTDETLHGSEHGARYAAEAGAHRKGQQLDVARIDAHGLGRDLVLAHGFPGTAYARVLQAHADDDDDDGQQQEQVIIVFGSSNAEAEQRLRAPEGELADGEGIDAVYALRTVGDVDGRIQVVHEDAHDFAEPQGHDGQVVAPQLQGGRAQHGAE